MRDPDNNVVSLRSERTPSRLHPRLEEFRQILRESDPLPPDDALSDENVLRSEVLFRARFGRGFDWGLRHRDALIRLKHEMDLTDTEIRLFRRTGNLRRTATGVKLSASPWVAAWGGVQVFCLGTLLAVAVLAGWHNLLYAPLHYLQAWLMMLAMATVGYLLYWSQIKPWWISRHLRS